MIACLGWRVTCMEIDRESQVAVLDDNGSVRLRDLARRLDAPLVRVSEVRGGWLLRETDTGLALSRPGEPDFTGHFRGGVLTRVEKKLEGKDCIGLRQWYDESGAVTAEPGTRRNAPACRDGSRRERAPGAARSVAA